MGHREGLRSPLDKEKLMRTTIMKKIVVFFVMVFMQFVSPLYATKISLFEPGGECKIMLPGNIQIGTVVSLTLSCTPSEDGEAGSMQVALNLKGLEFVDLPASVPGASARILWKGKVSKGTAITKQMSFKVTRPGVWNMGGGFAYGPAAPESELGYAIKYGMGQSLYLVATDQGVTAYEKQDDIPKEAYTIPSSMTLDYFESKGKKEGKHLTAYLPKETRLDFEPTYQFKPMYGASHYSVSADLAKLTGTAQWHVEGNIGTVDQTGLFTATKFGNGKVCVKHSVLEDCMDVEVMPLPNPSPGDQIILTVVVPYDSPEEKAWVKQLLPLLKVKKVKSKKEAKELLFPKISKRVNLYGFEEENAWKETIMDGTTLLKGNKTPPQNARVDMKIKKESTVNVSVHFYSFAVTASGEIVMDATKEGPCVRNMSTTTYVCKSLGFLGEGSYTFTEPGVYEIGTTIFVVK